MMPSITGALSASTANPSGQIDEVRISDSPCTPTQAIIGPSAVIAAIGYASIRALGRNPSAAGKILQAMIIALIFAESIAVIALLILFQLFGRG